MIADIAKIIIQVSRSSARRRWNSWSSILLSLRICVINALTSLTAALPNSFSTSWYIPSSAALILRTSRYSLAASMNTRSPRRCSWSCLRFHAMRARASSSRKLDTSAPVCLISRPTLMASLMPPRACLATSAGFPGSGSFVTGEPVSNAL